MTSGLIELYFGPLVTSFRVQIQMQTHIHLRWIYRIWETQQ